MSNKSLIIYRDDAITEYLAIAQQLDMFGIDFFEIKNKRTTNLLIGVSATGLAIYRTIDRYCTNYG